MLGNGFKRRAENRKREVRVVTVVVSGICMQVGGGDLQGTRKIECMSENRGDARAVRGRIKEGSHAGCPISAGKR